jgi:diphosphomevalonate decarboxylase
MQKTGSVTWKCPSNIALVKYWGKFGRQYPQNPSISFTLKNAHTITKIEYALSDKAYENADIEFLFEGQSQSLFAQKIKSYLESVTDILPFIPYLKLKIESKNSFPHSSGIASSASSMAALAMGLVDIRNELEGTTQIDHKLASTLARLASGSASRSVYPKIAIWGKSPFVPHSSNDYAIPYFKDIHPIFNDFKDDILIVSKKEKSVSSRAGHALMENNPYASSRFQQAHSHLNIIIDAMKAGDLDTFGLITEKEALTLHALMMSSNPPYILMEPATIKIINLIQQFRTDTHVPVYFTLDAGPNVHMLYPTEFSPMVDALKSRLRDYCVDGKIIEDELGDGPEKL